ncbi:MAG: glutamate racemase [Elainellaceae cyanobacterium]
MGAPSTGRIGIFDSGVGGLTVLKAIHRRLPHEPVLYFGDTARLPYGTRCEGEILQFVREIVDWMQQEQVKLVIMACNTSSALALHRVRREYAVPLLGMIEPAAAQAAGGRRIGVIATPATVASHAYRSALARLNPAAQVWEVGCPKFVPLIEQNRIHDAETRSVVRAYLAPLLKQRIDTLIYGCTHYPLLDPVIEALLPPTVRRIDPAAQVAIAAAQMLPASACQSPSTRFCVSGDPDAFSRLAGQWLGYRPKTERVVPSLHPSGQPA